jgi:hypothetical protein
VMWSLLILNSEWVAGDHSSVAQWDKGTTNYGISYHRVYRQTQLLFSETNDQADWGYWYYATKNTTNLSFQQGADTSVRGAFESNGILANTQDTNYRPINQQWPVFGFSSDLGSVTSSVNTLYTIGLTQQQAIQFAGQTGIVPLASLWTSYFPSETDAVSIPPLISWTQANNQSFHFSIMIMVLPVATPRHLTKRSQKTP